MGYLQFCKKRPLVFSALVLSALFWTCSINPKSMALGNYVNRDILGIAGLETAAWEPYNAVVGEHYTSDTAVLDALKNEVIPIYERFFHLLKQIQPQDGELAQIHALYIRGASNVLNGFRVKLAGIENQKEEMILAGNQQIGKGAEETYQWREQLLALYDSRNAVAMTKKENTALDKVYQFLTWDAATVGEPVTP
ncbi:hypothetical protein D3OALGB2SA_906 [Olavius algarvensis associated proteobacterium Delta 3]|nr:hypothetical protein D3OALGB2SA_906 [Olavius algarvensis associated proteobacterium Delta 3]